MVRSVLEMAENGDVVVEPADPRFPRKAYDVADKIKLAFASVAWFEEDGSGFLVLERVPRADEVHHFEIDAKLGAALPVTGQQGGCPL